MTTVLTNEILPFCLRNATGNEELAEALISKLSDKEFEALQFVLSEILAGEVERGTVSVTDPATRQPTVFRSIIYDGEKSKDEHGVVAFSFSNALTESLLPVCGILITVFTGHLGLANLTGAAGAAKAFWASLCVLRSPQDDTAIEVIHALGRVRAKHRRLDIDADPSTSELLSEMEGSKESLITALRQLESKKIVKIKTWGSQSGDYTDGNNRWTIRL